MCDATDESDRPSSEVEAVASESGLRTSALTNDLAEFKSEANNEATVEATLTGLNTELKPQIDGLTKQIQEMYRVYKAKNPLEKPPGKPVSSKKKPKVQRDE